jgi:MFS family permease
VTDRGALVVFASAAIGIVAYAGAIGVMHAAIVDLAPHAVEQASGVVLTGFYLGAWSSPFLFGVVADGPGFRAAWLMSAGALVGAGATFAGAVAGARRALDLNCRGEMSRLPSPDRSQS